MQTENTGDFDINIKPNPQTAADQIILQKFCDVLAQTNNFIAVYELGQVIRGLYEFFGMTFAMFILKTPNISLPMKKPLPTQKWF